MELGALPVQMGDRGQRPRKGVRECFFLEEYDKDRTFLSAINPLRGNSSLVAKFRNVFIPSANTFTVLQSYMS